MNKSSLSAILLGSILGASVVAAPAAMAAYRRMSATVCRTPSGSSAIVTGTGYATNGNVVCAFPDDGYLPKEATTGTLYADVSAQNAGVHNSSNPVSACVWYVTGSGGACGANAYGENAGWNSLVISRSAWQAHPSDYPFISASPNSTSSFAGAAFFQ